MNDTIETAAPVASLQEQARTTAVATIKSVALAKVRAVEPVLRALAERYRDVVYDVSTPKGLAEAKAARHDLRENGRYAVQRAEQAVRDEANAVKKDISSIVPDLIAIVKPTEDALDKIITKREAELEAEKEAKRQAEAARVQKHRDALASIRGYVDLATGLPAERIQKGIDRLQAMVFGFEWEEFALEAAETRNQTVKALTDLHAAAVTREAEAARLEAQRAEQARIAAEQAAEAQRIADEKAELARQRAELEAQQAAIIAAAKREQEDREAAQLAQQQVDDLATCGVSVLRVSVDEAGGVIAERVEPAVIFFDNAPAQQEAEPDNGFAYYVERLGRALKTPEVESALTLARICAGYGAERNLDMRVAANGPTFRESFERVLDRANWVKEANECFAEVAAQGPATVWLEGPAPDYPQLGPDIEDLCTALLDHIAKAWGNRFPTQPHMAPAWWADLRAKSDALKALLDDEA